MYDHVLVDIALLPYFPEDLHDTYFHKWKDMYSRLSFTRAN